MVGALPGGDLVTEGILDLESGRETIASCLVSIGAARLRRSGVAVPERTLPGPEHRLYGLLSREDPDAAHGRYNALIRRLVSYERARECAI